MNLKLNSLYSVIFTVSVISIQFFKHTGLNLITLVCTYIIFFCSLFLVGVFAVFVDFLSLPLSPSDVAVVDTGALRVKNDLKM